MNKTITRIEFIGQTTYGNPRYRIGFDDATSAITKSNAMYALYVERHEGYRVGDRVTVNYTKAGRIDAITPVPPVNLKKDYEVRVFGKTQAGVSPYRPIAIYAGLSVAKVHSLRVRFAGTGHSLYTFKDDRTAKI